MPVDPDQVSFVRRGSGSPLVLIHGLGSRHEAWEPVIDELSESYDVIALDLPGFGQTPVNSFFRRTTQGYAEWATSFFAALGVTTPHVAGNSMGGAIAIELGRNGIAGAVTAFSPGGFWDDAGLRWAQACLTSLRGIGKVSLPLLERTIHLGATRAALLGAVVAHPTRVSPESALLQAEGLIHSEAFGDARDSFHDYRLAAGDDWGALTSIPTTVAWGTRDYLLTYRTQAKRARTAMPFAHHVDLPGCGHVPFVDNPGLCARTIRTTA